MYEILDDEPYEPETDTDESDYESDSSDAISEEEDNKTELETGLTYFHLSNPSISYRPRRNWTNEEALSLPSLKLNRE